jgi:tubulin epsilon
MYSSVLAINKLIEHADCVLPIDNQSLMDIASKITATSKGVHKTESEATSFGADKSKRSKPFDSMNNIAAHLLLNLTRYVINL